MDTKTQEVLDAARAARPPDSGTVDYGQAEPTTGQAIVYLADVIFAALTVACEGALDG